uniref:Jacalin-type lectin domain-containing protein n=1 Tax=Salvator merianae TaxID=96440 RepID=A0A8D0B4M8_SALMN
WLVLALLVPVWEGQSSNRGVVVHDEIGCISMAEKGTCGGMRFLHISIQVRYGDKWSDHVGGKSGKMEEFFLFPGESIIQVTGKSHIYVNKLVFITDRGRQFPFGTDSGISFNAVPLFQGTVLRFISGRAGVFIDAISFHWDYEPNYCVVH